MKTVILRMVQQADHGFLCKLYDATRGEELRIGGFGGQALDMLLPLQFEAERQYFLRRFPCAEHAIIEGPHGSRGRWYVHRTTQEIRLVDISLLPDARGQGIGGSLLRRLQAESERSGLPLRLSVVRGNPARRLVQRLGFIETGSDGIQCALEWRAGALLAAAEA